MGAKLIGALLALTLTASPAVGLARVQQASAVVPTSAEGALLQLQELAQQAEAGQLKEALPRLQAIVGSSGFSELTREQQYAGYLLLGAVADHLKEYDVAYDAYVKATEWKGADADAWMGRLGASAKAHKDAQAALTVAAMARLYPQGLGQINDHYLVPLAFRLRHADPRHDAEFQLLEALYDAKWKPDDIFDSPSALWTELAFDLIERGDNAKAAQVLGQPLDPYDVVRIRTDRRFDSVVQSRLADFDVKTIAERRLAETRKLVAEHPRSLHGVNALALRLRDLGRYQEALALLDETIARATPPDGEKSAFDDLDELNWTLDYRSQALQALGREDEAVEALKRGARRPEHGDLNVSQAINLGQYLSSIGRPKDAIYAVADITRGNVSGYGWLSLQLARVCAFAQLGDQAATKSALDDITAHQDDGMVVAELALLCAGDEAGAAALYVKRLQDPAERPSALQELQIYDVRRAMGSQGEQLDKRLAAVRGRPEVKAAIAAVGRVEHQPLAPSMF